MLNPGLFGKGYFFDSRIKNVFSYPKLPRFKFIFNSRIKNWFLRMKKNQPLTKFWIDHASLAFGSLEETSPVDQQWNLSFL